jgi:uncharacterized protein (UPF0332 family)
MANIFAEKSDQTWKEGKECLERGLVNMAANRIYYSVLQAIKGFAVGKRLWQVNESDNVHTKAMNIICGSAGGKGHGYRRKFGELRGLRITADYLPEDADLNQLKDLVKDADAIRKYHIEKAD